MSTLVMDGSDIEHAAPVIEEYGDEVMCAGWNPQLALVDTGSVEQIDEHRSDEERTGVLGAVLDYAPKEATGSVKPLRAATIPQCP